MRSRWAAAGAAIAVTLGTGGLRLAAASDPDPSPTLTTISPCRLLDTRPGPGNVGPRSTPLGDGQTFTAAVRGTNGQCTIPDSAIGVTLNVTAVQPTGDSFLTVFPGGTSRPNASSLNWRAGQGATPNAVTSALGPTGSLGFYNHDATVHLVVDVTGYLTDHDHDDQYASEPGDTSITVRGDGTPTVNGAALRAALEGIDDASASRPYLLDLAPGIYDVGGTLATVPHVVIRGAGNTSTTIRASASSDDEETGEGAAALVTPGGSSLADLAVETTGGDDGAVAIGVLVSGPGPVQLDDVAVRAGAGETTEAVMGLVARAGAQLQVRDSSIEAVGGTVAARAITVLDADVTVRSSDMRTSGTAPFQVDAYTVPLGARLAIHDSRLLGAFGAVGSNDIWIASTLVTGGALGSTCVHAYDEDFEPLDAVCQSTP